MSSRLLLKAQKLDKFDLLDKNVQIEVFSQPTFEITQSFTTQMHHTKFNQLARILSSEYLCNQRLYNKFLSKNKRDTTLKTTLRSFKSNLILEFFLNSVLLSENFKLFYNKATLSFVLTSIINVRDLLSPHNNINRFFFRSNTGNLMFSIRNISQYFSLFNKK